jgi:uncharacterized membrane protein YgcG
MSWTLRERWKRTQALPQALTQTPSQPLTQQQQTQQQQPVTIPVTVLLLIWMYTMREAATTALGVRAVLMRIWKQMQQQETMRPSMLQLLALLLLASCRHWKRVEMGCCLTLGLSRPMLLLLKRRVMGLMVWHVWAGSSSREMRTGSSSGRRSRRGRDGGKWPLLGRGSLLQIRTNCSSSTAGSHRSLGSFQRPPMQAWET